jgi:hypothetical protein
MTKKKLHINNAEYAVLEASEDFMKTALILVSGLVTDRIGGASQSILNAIPKSVANLPPT